MYKFEIHFIFESKVLTCSYSNVAQMQAAIRSAAAKVGEDVLLQSRTLVRHLDFGLTRKS